MPLFNRRQSSSSASAVVAIGTVVSAVDTNTRSSYTFSGMALGAADAGRVIVVGTSSGGDTNSTVSSLTVGGVSAVEAVELQHQGDAYYRSSLWVAEVPTGTTGDVVVAMSGSTGDCGIIVWPTTGAESTPHATASDASDAGGLTVDLNVEADGAIIAYSACNAGPGWSWTGVTEDIDEIIDAGWFQSGASAEFESASTPQTVSCVPPGSSREGLIVLSLSSFSPALPMSDSGFTDNKVSNTSESTWTQTNVSFGTPAEGRLVVVGIMCPDNNAPTITGVTIGGVTATLTKAATRTGSMWHAFVPSGASGTVVTTFSGSISQKYMGVWEVHGANATQPFSSATTNTNGGALGITTPNNSYICGIGATDGDTSCTWSGLTEDFDDDSATSAGVASGASSYFATTQAPQAITATFAAAGGAPRFISASFKPV